MFTELGSWPWASGQAGAPPRHHTLQFYEAATSNPNQRGEVPEAE